MQANILDLLPDPREVRVSGGGAGGGRGAPLDGAAQETVLDGRGQRLAREDRGSTSVSDDWDGDGDMHRQRQREAGSAEISVPVSLQMVGGARSSNSLSGSGSISISSEVNRMQQLLRAMAQDLDERQQPQRQVVEQGPEKGAAEEEEEDIFDLRLSLASKLYHLHPLEGEDIEELEEKQEQEGSAEGSEEGSELSREIGPPSPPVETSTLTETPLDHVGPHTLLEENHAPLSCSTDCRAVAVVHVAATTPRAQGPLPRTTIT